MMGINPVDARRVASLIGVKTFLNEFIAYKSINLIKKKTKKTRLFYFNLYFINHFRSRNIYCKQKTILKHY